MCACVLVSQVRLYMDCEEYHRVAFTRSPQPLTFEASSGIFVGNAGGTGLPRFVVSLDGTASTVTCVFFVVFFNHVYITAVSVCITISCKLSRIVRIFLFFWNTRQLCMRAALLHIPHSLFQKVWINCLTQYVKSTFSWRNKRGVWAVAYCCLIQTG